jgi:predicted ABC-type ATPase
LQATNPVKRLRVFAGPNGSGKSTIIEAIRSYRVGQSPIDFGVYINADDIAQALSHHSFAFQDYRLTPPSRQEFIQAALQTGLINDHFTEAAFKACFSLGNDGQLKLKQEIWREHFAQLLATVLREMLLAARAKLSFETVFSHPSKLDFMRQAVEQGYKVYLYFICTESPEINIARIKEVRVQLGGHDVPENKIRARYKRSLELMYDAAQLAYQAWFFDNSADAVESKAEYFAHFKVVKGKQEWGEIKPAKVPNWFVRYYLDKL